MSSIEKSTVSKIGKHIAELRKEKNLKQWQLAQKLYVHEKTVSKWERGVVAPDITIIKSIAKEFNVSVDEILSGEKIENNQIVENATVNAINVYSNQTKRKVLKRTIFIFLLILFVILTIFLVDRYYRWDVKRFEVDGEFHMLGYSFSNNIESKIIINHIAYHNYNIVSDNTIKNDYVEIGLYSNDEMLCYDKLNYTKENTIYDIFNTYNFICETKKKIDYDNLSLHFKFYNNSDQTIKIVSLK